MPHEWVEQSEQEEPPEGAEDEKLPEDLKLKVLICFSTRLDSQSGHSTGSSSEKTSSSKKESQSWQRYS